MGSPKMQDVNELALPFHVSPPLSPAEPDCERARAMAATVMTYDPATDADALRLLRAMYPQAPLTLRVIALELIARRRNGQAFQFNGR
jgi:hypothetical protein